MLFWEDKDEDLKKGGFHTPKRRPLKVEYTPLFSLHLAWRPLCSVRRVISSGNPELAQMERWVDDVKKNNADLQRRAAG
jgi:hypothetical protein